MNLNYVKAALGSVWVLGTFVAANAIGISTVSGRAALVGVTLLPPIVMWRLWNEPRQTMSESIDQARR